LGEGWAVVAAEYRAGASGWRGRAMVDDALDLLTWVLTEGAAHGLDPTKVVVTGGSAGAHVGLLAALVANAAAEDLVVKGVVARYGAVGDLQRAHQEHASRVPRGLGEWLALKLPGGRRDGRRARVRGWDERAALEHIAGGSGGDLAAELAYLSPTTHVGPWAPPTVVLHSLQDEFYAHGAHAGAFGAAMAQAKRPHLMLEPQWHSHGCDIGSTAPFQLTKHALVGLLRAVDAGGNAAQATASAPKSKK
jgi:acetyl esterase/lipase